MGLLGSMWPVGAMVQLSSVTSIAFFSRESQKHAANWLQRMLIFLVLLS